MSVRSAMAETVSPFPQKVSLIDILSLRTSGHPESILETEDHMCDLDGHLADLLENARDLMNQRGEVAPSYLFEPEFGDVRKKWMILYQNRDGAGMVLIPPILAGFNGTDPEIKPAYISDGYGDAINERQNLLQYLRSNFTFDEKKELLEAMLDWLQANFSDQETSSGNELCRLVRDFNSSIRRVLAQDQL